MRNIELFCFYRALNKPQHPIVKIIGVQDVRGGGSESKRLYRGDDGSWYVEAELGEL